LNVKINLNNSDSNREYLLAELMWAHILPDEDRTDFPEREV